MFYFNFFVTKPHFVKNKKTELECDVTGQTRVTEKTQGLQKPDLRHL